MSQTGRQIIAVDILPYVSRGKGSQTMKFGQLALIPLWLIEYNREMFLENSYTKCGGEASPRPFYKKSKLGISKDQRSESYIVCCYCLSKSKSSKTLKLRS